MVWAKGLLKSVAAVAAGQAFHISDLPRSSTSETILRLRIYTEQAIYAWCSRVTLAYSKITQVLPI